MAPKARILLVEDNIPLRNLCAEALEEEHYEVVVAGTGQEGLDLARAQRFDLLVVDVHLPGGMSGSTMVKDLREKGSRPNVLYMTSDPDEGVIKEPGKHLVFKPVEREPFLDNVRRALKA